MKSRLPFIVALSFAASVSAGFVRIPKKAYEEWRKDRGAKKSSSGHGTKRIDSTEYSGWKKLFGGLAVPKFSGIVPRLSEIEYSSSSRGPRPNTFYKTQRAAAVSILAVIALAFTGCSTVESVAGNKLAQETVAAVAQHYGGAQAGELAAAGLSATADVIQGYVDKRPPMQVVANSPGVKGVSQIVVDYLKTKGVVTQETVDSIHVAAQIAEHATVSTANEGP